jgi:hypothetical protein
VGILDHRRQWQFTLAASSEQCVQAFSAVFDGTRGGAPLIARAKWGLQRTPEGAVATYLGRGGMIAALTILTERGSNEQAGAVGSQITFETAVGENGVTVCRMWLSSSASTFGFTNDARFFRPYMRRVEGSLTEVDPRLVVRTS